MSFSRTGLRNPVKIVCRGRNVAPTFRNPVAACYSPGEMHAQTPARIGRIIIRARTADGSAPVHPRSLIFRATSMHTYSRHQMRFTPITRRVIAVAFLRFKIRKLDTIDIPTNYRFN